MSILRLEEIKHSCKVSGGSKKLKGEVCCDDCATDCDGVYECAAKITTKALSAYPSEHQAAAKKQAVEQLTAALVGFTTQYNSL